MGSLREIAAAASSAGRPAVHRLRRPARRPRRVRAPGQRRQPRRSPSRGRRPRRPGGRAVGQQPRVVPELLGDGQPRRHPRRAQRLVEDRRDPLRPRGLRGQGAGRRRAALRAHRRPARTECSEPRGGLPGRRRRRSAYDDPAASEPCDRPRPTDADPTSSPTPPIDEDDPAVIFYTRGTTGRPKGAISHPPEHDRQPPEHDVQHRPRQDAMADPRGCGRGAPARRARASACSPRRSSTCRAATRSLVVGMLAGAEAGDPRGQASTPTRRSSSSRTRASPSGRRCRPWCGGSASTPAATTTTPRRSPPSRSAARRRPTSSSARSTTRSPTCKQHVQRLRPHRVQLGRHRHLRPGRLDNGPTSVGPPVPVVDLAVIDADGNEVPTGETGEVLIKGPDHHAGLLEQARGHGRDRHRRLAAHRRHRPRRRRRATSTSPTGPRT